MRPIAATVCLLLATACAAPERGIAVADPPAALLSEPSLAPGTGPADDSARQPTRVLSAIDAARLQQNSGITLQWIGWDDRGPAVIGKSASGTYRLSGQQAGGSGGRLSVDGEITEIGAGYFELKGAIVISDTPDQGRNCLADRTWRFEVTQGRKYYRLRQFEWCDGLTDYIDIYF